MHSLQWTIQLVMMHIVSIEIADKDEDGLKGFIDQRKDAKPQCMVVGVCFLPYKVLDKKMKFLTCLQVVHGKAIT